MSLSQAVSLFELCAVLSLRLADGRRTTHISHPLAGLEDGWNVSPCWLVSGVAGWLVRWAEMVVVPSALLLQRLTRHRRHAVCKAVAGMTGDWNGPWPLAATSSCWRCTHNRQPGLATALIPGIGTLF